MLQVTAIDKYPNAGQSLLCYFQGGPGFQSPSPTDTLCWLNTASKQFRVVLLDQRGTGKSSPIRLSTLNAVGDEEAQARYCRYFRADSIVKDAEIVRKHLSPDNPSKPWSILGQSFGGFCCVEYLSKFPEGWSDALLSAVHACITVLSVHGSPAGAVEHTKLLRVPSLRCCRLG